MNDCELNLLQQILSGRFVPALPEEGTEGFNADFLKICSSLSAMRQTLEEFAKGNFENDITVRGAIAGGLKALQANLRHLTWQVQQVANGDFSQRVDFMGDFSKSFNLMTVQLDNTIRKLNESEQMLRQQAMYDSLTGLPNRYLLQDRFEQYVAGSQRSGESFFCSVVDLDYFKQVNDTYGHYTGDIVLKEFAQKISLCLRDTDTAARIGGDEFIFVCTCHKNEEKSTATMIMKRFYNSLKMPIQLEQISYYLHSSIGISFFPQHASDLTALLAKADEALYYSKARGRNTYTIWNDSLITDGQQG